MSTDFGAAVGFGGGLIGRAISAGMGRRSQKRADKYRRRFTRDQYGLMREGLEDAGFNPLLALGAMGNAPGSGPAPTPAMEPLAPAMASGAAMGEARETQRAQRGLLRSQTGAADATAQKTRGEASNVALNNAAIALDLAIKKKEYDVLTGTEEGGAAVRRRALGAGQGTLTREIMSLFDFFMGNATGARDKSHRDHIEAARRGLKYSVGAGPGSEGRATFPTTRHAPSDGRMRLDGREVFRAKSGPLAGKLVFRRLDGREVPLNRNERKLLFEKYGRRAAEKDY